jgi:hypothetical protein
MSNSKVNFCSEAALGENFSEAQLSSFSQKKLKVIVINLHKENL